MKRRVPFLLFLSAVILFSSCVLPAKANQIRSFSFVWGCYGISSYDSATGRLVKTTDSTHPDDYVAELFLSPQEEKALFTLLADLRLEEYPAKYDPYNDPSSDLRRVSSPSRDLILTVRTDDGEITVTCKDICLSGGGYDARADAFLTVCDRLQDFLCSTAEWRALPEYEFLYD